MGRRLLVGVLYGVVGYIAGAVGGGWATSTFSANAHDGSVEAAMTGAFVTGPLVAIIAAVVGFARAARRADSHKAVTP
jgi:hypothetical protein